MDENATIEIASADPNIGLVTDIVAAYLSHNRVQVGELPALIASTYAAPTGLAQPTTPAEPRHERATPAQIRKSITPDALVSFIDGKGYKTLKRHLSMHGLDPAGYRARYGLAADYPMTAASYSEARSSLARQLGLGNGRQRAASKAVEPAATVAPQARGRGKATGAPAKPTRARKPKTDDAAE